MCRHGIQREFRGVPLTKTADLCIPRGRQEQKRKTAIEMGGLREKRRQECRSQEWKETGGEKRRQKEMEKNISEGDWWTVAIPSPLKKKKSQVSSLQVYQKCYNRS